MNDMRTNEKSKMNGWNTAVTIGVLLFLGLLSLTLYTFAHEGGHALVGLLLGGKLTSFNINFFDLSAHAGIDGEFSLGQRALISVAGVSLPVILCVLFLLFSWKRNNTLFYYFKTILFFVTVNSLLAWIAIPVLTTTGMLIGDDSVNFLNYTHFSPFFVTGVALMVYVVCWGLFFRQAGGMRQWANHFRTASLDLSLPETRRTIYSLAAVGLVTLASSFGLSRAFPNHVFDIPDGYQQVAEIDLSKNSLSETGIYRFTIAEPTKVNFFILLTNIKGAPIKIRLSGPDGYDQVYLAMTDPKTNIGQASVTPQELLTAPGDYQIVATFPSCPGRVKVYVKMDGS